MKESFEIPIPHGCFCGREIKVRLKHKPDPKKWVRIPQDPGIKFKVDWEDRWLSLPLSVVGTTVEVEYFKRINAAVT